MALRLIAVLVLLAAACKGETAGGTAAAEVSPPTAQAPVPPAVRPPAEPRRTGPFDPRSLRCDRLLPHDVGMKILGFAPELLQRLSRHDGATELVCSHRGRRLDEAVSFQVSCGKSAASVFASLRALHAKAHGAQPLPIGKQGIATRTSALFLHAQRPCVVQVAGRGLAHKQGQLERLAAQLAAALP